MRFDAPYDRLQDLPRTVWLPTLITAAGTREARLIHVRAWLSALDAGSDLAQAFAAGASDYVTKPFNPEELLARLQRLLPNTWPTPAAGASAA